MKSTNIIPFPPTSPITTIRSGAPCVSAWDIHEVIKDRLHPGLQPELIFLYLDQDKTLIGSVVLHDKGDAIGQDDGAAIARGVSPKCREVVCIRSRMDIQHDRQSRNHELREKHWNFSRGIELAFACLKDVKLAEIYLAGESMMFAVKDGWWLSFKTFPGGAEFTREKALDDNVRSLAGIPQSDDEKHMLSVYRQLSPVGKAVVRAALDSALSLDLKYREVVRHVAEGKPLTDGEANQWSWLREKVLTGEFTA